MRKSFEGSFERLLEKKREKEPEKTFGSHLRELRMNHPEKLSMREVSRRTGVDVSYISKWERNVLNPVPSEELILKLAEILDPEETDTLLLLADRVPPSLKNIVKDHYQEIPSFFRSAKDLSPEDWNKLTNYMKKNILPKKDLKKR